MSGTMAAMQYRRLRICISAFFGVLTLLLCVLWARSYWWFEGYTIKPSVYYGGIGWTAGTLLIEGISPGNPQVAAGYVCRPIDKSSVRTLGFEYTRWNKAFSLAMPIYTLVLLTSVLTALPVIQREWIYLPNRFSLRTLLIATTIIAAMLGLVVWLK